MSQTNAVFHYLLNRGPITRLIAMHTLRVANLTAVIARLRKRGIEVYMENVQDYNGALYARYYLTPRVVNNLLLGNKIRFRGTTLEII